ncbi:MAG: diacylglycerol kinase family protein [Balneolaceae bacterium]
MRKSDDRVCFILNTKAQRGRARKKVEWLKKEAELRWENFDIHLTGEQGSVAGLSPKDYQKYDIVVACGGDGTLHNAVNRALHENIVVGLIPMGSGNDFAKAIHLPKDLGECLDVIKIGKTKKMDLIQCSGDVDRWCVNTLGVGFDGLANSYNSRLKRFVGRLGYHMGALMAAFKFKGSHMELSVDGKITHGNILMITACNGPIEGGSFVVGPDAKIDDGLIDLLTLKPTPLIKLLYYIPRFKNGIPKNLDTATSVKCSQIKIHSKTPVSVHGDGECLGSDIRDLDINIHPLVLNVIVP